MFVFSSVPMSMRDYPPYVLTYSLNRNTDDLSLFDSDGDIIQVRNLAYVVEE